MNYVSQIARRTLRTEWFFSVAAASVVLFIIAAGKGSGAAAAILPVAFSFAAMYVVVGIGQMFVIASGPGNIDLSIPMVMTLAAYLATGQMHVGTDVGLLTGLLYGIAAGIAFGFGNGLLILVFSIPPMISTLAMGLIAQSIAFVLASDGITKPALSLEALTSERISGVPTITIAVLVFSVFIAYVIRRSAYARRVFACGQNRRAAYLAGINVNKTMLLTYTFCGLLAGVAGILVAGFQGGASLSMASEYLVISIAVVVLGGTPITGGKATVTGIWGASVFLFLVTSLLNSYQVGPGMKNVFTGILILLVLVISSGIQNGSAIRLLMKRFGILKK